MFYVARCATGASHRSFTLRGALAKMRRLGSDAAVFAGRKWLAGRTFTESTIPTPAPREVIAVAYPASVIEALHAVAMDVDHDIEQQGAVSYETVERVRAVLALANAFRN